MDLSQLPLMSQLAYFVLKAKNQTGRLLRFRSAPTQGRSLAQCRQLTMLDCGAWSPDEREVDDEGWQLPPAEQQIADGIATLVRGLTSSAGGSPVSSSSSSSAAPAAEAAAPCVLEYLDLEGTSMSAAVWEHLSQLHSLTKLEPLCWCSDITLQQWSRLADFTQLQCICLVAHSGDDDSDAPLRTEHFLPPLLQCTQLTSVALVGASLSLSAAQLGGIARLPQLKVLMLIDVEMESAAPLASAVRLMVMFLLECRGPPGVVDFRRSLPPMPSLAFLRLDDRCHITAAQAVPLNAALFARMPQLTPSYFTQNLRQ